MGINKTNDEDNLLIFLGHYLGFILSATILSAVLFYQARKRCAIKTCFVLQNKKNHTVSFTVTFHRFMNGEPSQRPKLLFPGVTREDADKNIKSLLKYLHNYGFYKFGIEMTLVQLVILICFRKDAISIVYIIWLCIILSCNRRILQFIWPILQYFVMILTIMQYAIVLNFPLFLHLCKLISKF